MSKWGKRLLGLAAIGSAVEDLSIILRRKICAMRKMNLKMISRMKILTSTMI